MDTSFFLGVAHALAAWWAALPREFVFLLSLPFALGLLALACETPRRARDGRDPAAAGGLRPASGRSHVAHVVACHLAARRQGIVPARGARRFARTPERVFRVRSR
jgi:hypothetical protein